MKWTDTPKRVRTLFLSDLHLGCRLSNAPRCLEVLRHIQAEQLFLLGDLIDVARMSRLWYWPESHQSVVDAICHLPESGTKVSIAPGNHDECFRDVDFFSELNSRHRDQIEQIVSPLLTMQLAESFEYGTLSGRRLLLTHGDLFDTVDSSLGGIPKLGSRIFDHISWYFPNRLTHGLRWGFKCMLSRPDRVETAVIEHASKLNFDGVIFGHLHGPQLKTNDDWIVANTGDWIANESFLVETLDGDLKLVNFGDVVAAIERHDCSQSIMLPRDQVRR